jgi:TRAP-type transport system periplasmic protein
MSSARTLGVVLGVACALSSVRAAAEPTVLRLASVGPEGTAWARELKAWARDLETESGGAVKVKWYLGGIAGDELEMLQRMKRRQLDGVASGGPICERTAPSIRAMRVLGLIRDHQESAAVATRLQATFEQEATAQGFVFLGSSPIGPQILFTRRPIRSMDELRRIKLWVWEHDDMLRVELPWFGMQIVPGSLNAAGAMYDRSDVDGFVAPATVALAFQWSAHTRYFVELPMATLNGCVVVTRAAFDPLPLAAQKAVRTTVAKLGVRFGDLGRRQDAALLGGLFQKQGLIRVDIDDRFRTDFYTAARQLREKIDAQTVPPALLVRVQAILADYRAESHSR